MRVCVCVCEDERIYMGMYGYIYVHRLHVCMYVCMCVCTFICVHSSIKSVGKQVSGHQILIHDKIEEDFGKM